MDTNIQDKPDNKENKGTYNRSKKLEYLTPLLINPELKESPEARYYS